MNEEFTDWETEFDKTFEQDKSGERVDGYLLMNTGKWVAGDDREWCKIATPEDVKRFIAGLYSNYQANLEAMGFAYKSTKRAAEAAEDNNASLRAQLAEAVEAWDDLSAQLAEGREELSLNATMLARQCDLARQAEADRDQWQVRAQSAEASICKPGCETLVAVETERNALEADRDKWKGQAEWAWKWLTRWRDGAKRCKGRAMRMETERDAALARAEAMREALMSARSECENELVRAKLEGCVPDGPRIKCWQSLLEQISAALAHPEAQGERVRKECDMDLARVEVEKSAVKDLQHALRDIRKRLLVAWADMPDGEAKQKVLAAGWIAEQALASLDATGKEKVVAE